MSSRFANSDYQSMLEHHGALPSMNAAGNCYDNAMAESFVARLKKQRIY